MTTITLTLEDARLAFAKWWEDYTKDPSGFSENPDIEGKDSAECFFAYIARIQEPAAATKE